MFSLANNRVSVRIPLELFQKWTLLFSITSLRLQFYSQTSHAVIIDDALNLPLGAWVNRLSVYCRFTTKSHGENDGDADAQHCKSWIYLWIPAPSARFQAVFGGSVIFLEQPRRDACRLLRFTFAASPTLVPKMTHDISVLESIDLYLIIDTSRETQIPTCPRTR